MKKLLAITLMATLLGFSLSPVLGDDVTVGADVGKSISVTFNYTSVDFGTLFSGTYNNTVGGLAYNVSVETNYDYRVLVNATNFTDGGSNSFDVSNLWVDCKENVTELSSCDGRQLSHSPQEVEASSHTGVLANYHEYCLDIPSHQYATVYNSTVTWTYENQ